MSIISNDPKEVAESALRYEAEGYKILSDAKTAATDALSQATFGFLAAQELTHVEAIKAFTGMISGDGEFDLNAIANPLTEEDAKQEIKGIFAQFKDRFDQAAAQETRLDVYEVAMDMERRGHEFYSDAALKSTDAVSKKLYEFLAAEEQKHFDIIQDTHDFLKQPDAFMAVEERWMQF